MLDANLSPFFALCFGNFPRFCADRRPLGLLRQNRPARLGQARPGLQGLLRRQGAVADRHSRCAPEQGPASRSNSTTSPPRSNWRTTATRSKLWSIPAAISWSTASATTCSSFISTTPRRGGQRQAHRHGASTWCTKAPMESWPCIAVRLSEDTRRSQRHPCHPLAAPAYHRGRDRQSHRHGQSRRPVARRSRLLDLHGLSDRRHPAPRVFAGLSSNSR